MVGVRELVEAQAYERRRLVRAFVSGDPASPRADGPCTWRALLAGAALAIVALLGVAAAASLGLS